MTVAELKQELADVHDDVRVMVRGTKVSRFYHANVEEMEIDILNLDDGGYLRADVFTRSLHREKVILIVYEGIIDEN